MSKVKFVLKIKQKINFARGYCKVRVFIIFFISIILAIGSPFKDVFAINPYDIEKTDTNSVSTLTSLQDDEQKYNINILSMVWAPSGFSISCMDKSDISDVSEKKNFKRKRIKKTAGYTFLVSGVWTSFFDYKSGKIKSHGSCRLASEMNLNDFDQETKNRVQKDYIEKTGCLYLHQWNKYGSCLNLSSKVYFKEIFDYFDRYFPKIGVEYLKNNINRSVSYSDLEKSFNVDNKIGFPIFMCKLKRKQANNHSQTTNDPIYILKEYRLFIYDKKMQEEHMQKLHDLALVKFAHCPMNKPIFIPDYS